MSHPGLDEERVRRWTRGFADGSVVPVLGPGALDGARHPETGDAMPADNERLILALNQGRPMSPVLMHEFSRAAMKIEQDHGRPYLERFLHACFAEVPWTRAPVIDWLAQQRPAWVVDLNRDTQLQDAWAGTPHLLVQGIARVTGGRRYRVFRHDGIGYHELHEDAAEWPPSPSGPVLFKPLGTPRPEPSFVASDADFVDYLTELMGGFALPGFLKERRRGVRYLTLGLRFTRDTERMLFTEITQEAGEPKGWALLPATAGKERRYLARHGVTVIEACARDLAARAVGVTSSPQRA